MDTDEIRELIAEKYQTHVEGRESLDRLGHDPRSEFEQALEDAGWELRWYQRGIVLNEEPAFKAFCETGELEVGVA